MRRTAATLLSLRVAYGGALLAAPAKVAGNRWLGPGARQPAATVALRGLGAREVAVHGIALARLAREEPIRPWLAASLAGDVADILAAFASRNGLPAKSPAATAAVAGASAALTAAVAVTLDA